MHASVAAETTDAQVMPAETFQAYTIIRIDVEWMFGADDNIVVQKEQQTGCRRPSILHHQHLI